MKNAARNWQTTLAGILSLAFAGLQIYHDPTLALDPKTATAVALGVGLIAAKDGNKSGTASGM